MADTALDPVQSGWQDGNAWNEATAFTVGGDATGGLGFEPTALGEQLVLGSTARQAGQMHSAVTLTGTVGTTQTGTIFVEIPWWDFTPVAWTSGQNLPAAAIVPPGRAYTSQSTILAYVSGDFVEDTVYTWTLALPQLHNVVRHSMWNGRLNLVMRTSGSVVSTGTDSSAGWVSGVSWPEGTVWAGQGESATTTPQFSLSAVTMTLVDTSANTGLVGPWHAHARADECPRCGTWSTRDTWVRDGFTDIMLCSTCYDPEDPLKRRRRVRGERIPVGEN